MPIPKRTIGDNQKKDPLDEIQKEIKTYLADVKKGKDMAEAMARIMVSIARRWPRAGVRAMDRFLCHTCDRRNEKKMCGFLEIEVSGYFGCNRWTKKYQTGGKHEKRI